jgi:DNA-binding CsgD family transcriptional regulator
MGKEIKHYGMPRRSGRYPWGSGENPQRSIDFRGRVKELRKQGMSEVDIAKGEGIKVSQLRAKMSLAKAEERAAKRAEVLRLVDKGYSNVEIGRRTGLNESSVRSLRDPILAERASIIDVTANMLKESVDQKRFIDVGAGVENHIGVSRTKLNTAVALLQEQGYKLHKVNVNQIGMPGQFTIMKVLGAPDTTWKEVVNDISKIQSITARSDDFGRTFKSDLGLKPIQSVDSKRVQVRYAEDGGNTKDGVIELRRGVSDLNLGRSKYAQVRIGVDGTHYLKGMAIYSDKMPDGIDIVFNTNKHNTGNKLDAMKSLKDDPDNPFSSTIKRQQGSINIVYEEGDWAKWSRTISSQVLSKQTVPLAKTQLDLALKQKQEEYEEIMSLTNPTLKKHLLISKGGFADDCDAAAVHLKAAALPRQASKVILPIPDIKENEVYAPGFKNGESVVLIRHPHGGTFEIPQLKVNNKSKPAKDVMENAIDAIGIHPKVAQKLSGADFDGDTVIVIPNNRGVIKTSASLKGLENFDPIEAYPGYPGMKKINPKTKQTKMGEVSNLITDMTIKGANVDEIARAVRHSMVVIDSEKHNLNYKQSYIDNGIAALSEKYQNSKRGGASTLISKASSEVRVPHRKSGYIIDQTTGRKVYTETGQTYVDGKGRIIKRTSPSTRMAETPDAFKLSSGRPIEEVYASYANNLKSLANTSRLNALKITPTPYNPSARIAYENEVATLNAKLNVALKNKPIERQAQIMANSVIARKKQANPDMDNDDLKKVRNQALAEARARTGAKKIQVDITDREWEAIQAGAITSSKLMQILQNADLDKVKQLATPRTTVSITPAKVNLAKARLSSGYTIAEVAESLGVSVSTLLNALE